MTYLSVLPVIEMSVHLSDPLTDSTQPNAGNHTTTVYQSQKECEHVQSSPTIQFYPKPETDYNEIAQNPDVFFNKLQGFHRSFGTKFKVPTIGGKPLDLHLLFVEVTSRGGIEKVIRDCKWKEVTVIFKFPSTITSASFVLRKYYLSLLYHFEQAYYFRKEAPFLSLSDTTNGSVSVQAFEDTAAVHEFPAEGNFNLELGSSVNGTIDAKFDYGYLITVDLGSEKLRGVLYHTPTVHHVSPNSETHGASSYKIRKRRKLALRESSRPKPNRSGYNFFFSEHYNRLKPLYHGQEKGITKKIGHLWTRLTDAEKQVYQEKGLRDKERYRAEMLQYTSLNHS